MNTMRNYIERGLSQDSNQLMNVSIANPSRILNVPGVADVGEYVAMSLISMIVTSS